MQKYKVFGLCALLISAGARCQAAPVSIPLPAKMGELTPGKSLPLSFNLPAAKSVALQIKFKDAAFSGATILTKVNGSNMLPYHAFGGDTRYDKVKGKPGMHPPLERIEANYSLVAGWMKKGVNHFSITNAGPGKAIIETISVRDISGHNLPRYENPIYFDFDVWRQGLTLKQGTSWYLDSLFLGIIPGGGNYVMNYSGGDGMPLKLGAEEARIGWGFGQSHFYAIWHLVTTAKEWAKYVDVDNNKETTGRIHTQLADPAAKPAGADIALIDAEKYFNILKPGIDNLLPYSTYYNITTEQWGPRGQGFTDRDTRLTEKWGKEGYTFKVWADNYQETFTRLGKYIHEKNPGAPILAPQWWVPDIRFPLYDTSLERGFKMRDMTDALATHYYSFPYPDYDKDGQPIFESANPQKEYPGGTFDDKSDFWKWRQYMGTWIQLPEIAIDFNRYRLSRTEKDLLPAVKISNPKAGHWSSGQPIRYTAGFDGDEYSYNNETAIYDRNYSGPSPYQFLYAHLNYSLLPTAASEDKEFKVTRTLPLDPEAPPTDDIFSEVDIPINRYGNWVDGAAHTHRLRTRDPLYGDMFGYTGFEYGNSGDYIWLSGIKERYHRREPHNAQNLVRRTCYAFVTKGEVFPAIVNDPDTNQLVVKSLVVKQDWKDIIGLYAVNFDDKPHTLDVSLPVGWSETVTAQVFNDQAADWSDAREEKMTPQAGTIRYKVTVPPRSPWLVFIYPPTGKTYQIFGGPPAPQPIGPWGNQNVTDKEAVLKWKPSPTGKLTYEVQLAREMLFRRADDLKEISVTKSELRIEAIPPNQRYHWRVRAIDANGKSSGWSRPQSFWYQAATPGTAPTGDAPPLEITVPRAEPQAGLKPFTDAGNLAHTGQPFAHGNYWEGAGEAVDGFAASQWVSWGADYEGRKPVIPAWWAVRFDNEQSISEARVLWGTGTIGKDFDIQTWDGKVWQTAKAVRGNAEAQSIVKLDAPIRTRAVRIWISAAVATDIGIAEIYIH